LATCLFEAVSSVNIYLNVQGASGSDGTYSFGTETPIDWATGGQVVASYTTTTT
jgi:hypothetical protein